MIFIMRGYFIVNRQGKWDIFRTKVSRHFRACSITGKAVNYHSKEGVSHGATDHRPVPGRPPPAIEMADADIYSNPWVLVAGIVFFVIFLFGLARFVKAIRRIGEERYRR